MKRALLAATAVLTSSFTPIAITPAFAEPIPSESVPTLSDMQAYCETQYPITATNTVEATEGTPVLGSPTHTGNFEDSAVKGPDLSSSVSYSGATLTGDVGRIGGSPNMFKSVAYDTKTYSASLVDRTWETTQTDLYPFTCDRYHDEVTTEVVTNPGADNPGLGNCVGDPSDGSVNNTGPGNGAIHANPHSACASGTTIYHHTWVLDESVPYEFAVTTLGSELEIDYSVAIPFDEHNGPYDIYTAAVVCISPAGSPTKKNPGTWRPQNGYGGANCNTAYYTTAPQLYGRRVDSTNSVPAS
jgi:hypothetical protein